MVLSPPLHVGRPLGFAPEAALEDLAFPLRGPGVEVVQLLGLQGSWQQQVFGVVGGSGSREYSALEGYGNQYWPIHSSILGCRTPSLTETPGRPQSTGLQRAGLDQINPTCVDARLFVPVAALPQ